PAAAAAVPTEALAGAERRDHFRCRRQRDPLGEGQPCTWRLLLIKVAAEVIGSTRRVVVRLSRSWPHLHHFPQVGARLAGPAARAAPSGGHADNAAGAWGEGGGARRSTEPAHRGPLHPTRQPRP